ncbi:sulfite exporter TauE/SafE family protein [Nitratireductor sp.]|uniref:sulfite exporter TauE/SafE family protein n=1 Tax=Nitratireductor sp. TaxID=1872084 RepID=UPI002600ACCB|nr:sulfite exporter TauE/SafE family protein [Nitratireductor sp.]
MSAWQASSSDAVLLLIALAFAVAGIVKGGVGLGLPPIAMAFLVLAMPPVEAASLLVVPSLLTNLWQAVSGGALLSLLRRFWTLLVVAALVTILGTGWLARGNGDSAITLLGVVLILYAASALRKLAVKIGTDTQRWLGPVIGGLTGAATAATGVSSVPVVPYLQSLDLNQNELIQVMGLSFTVSTISLAINLSVSHHAPAVFSLASLVAVICAFGGMWVGAIIRRRTNPTLFRTTFLWVLLCLGIYLVLR